MSNREEDLEKKRRTSSYVVEERGARWTSWLIPVFVIANVAVFVVVMYINNCPKKRSNLEGQCKARFLARFSFQPLDQNPLLGPSRETLKKLGALKWSKVVHEHQIWRLITCIWLHAGLIHLLVNMLSIILIGIRLEQQFGFVRIGLIYLLSGLGASILSCLFLQNGISVVASGALFGLLGAMLSELMTNWTIYSNKAAALCTLVVIVVINLGAGIFPFVDYFADIGGFITGSLLGFILLLRPQFGWVARCDLPADIRVRSKYKAYQYVLCGVSLLLLVAGFTLGLVFLFQEVNPNKHCHWCHYLNCVPTSKWKCDQS